MHEPPDLSPEYPVFEGALHDYAEISAANTFPRAVAVVEYDNQPEPASGPASRVAQTHDFV